MHVSCSCVCTYMCVREGPEVPGSVRVDDVTRYEEGESRKMALVAVGAGVGVGGGGGEEKGGGGGVKEEERREYRRVVSRDVGGGVSSDGPGRCTRSTEDDKLR